MKILITGGDGFIGRYIANFCVQEGHTAQILDIKQHGDIRSAINIPHPNQIDAVIHLAAVTSPLKFLGDPFIGYETNVMGTFNILEFAKKHKIGKVILASSSSIYGNNFSLMNVQNLYPVSKRINEITAEYYSQFMNISVLRYFNTYGVDEDIKKSDASVIWKFVNRLKTHNNLLLYGDGSQSRDFIHVTDVARASLLALDNNNAFRIYDIGTGVSTSFNMIVKMLSDITFKDIKVEYEPIPYVGYQTYTRANPLNAWADFSFRSNIPLKKGMEMMC